MSLKKRRALERLLGKNSKKYREIVKNVKENNDRLRKKTKMKFVKKAMFLTAKYGDKNLECREDLTRQEKTKYGRAKIFSEDWDPKPEVIKGPVIVCRDD